MDRVTYGELMTRAAQHVIVGWARYPLADIDEAYQALVAFTDLVHALARHARHLTDRNRSRTKTHPSAAKDPLLGAASRLSQTLNRAGSDENRLLHFQRVADGSLPFELRSGAIAVNAATDLLNTHRAADGTWRTPESPVLGDLSIRLTGMSDVARMAICLADERPTLLNAVRATGMDPAWLTNDPLPKLTSVRAAACQVHITAARIERAAVLTQAVAVGLDVRTGHPLNEITDRLASIRVSAWRAATYPDAAAVGVSELLTFATTALTLHGAAALANTRLANNDNQPEDTNLVKILQSRAQHWRHIRAQLLRLDSPSWPDLTLSRHAVAVRRLLAAMVLGPAGRPTTLEGSRSAATLAPAGRDHQVGPSVSVALNRAAGTFEQVAEWNAIALRSLIAKDKVLIPDWTPRGKQGRQLHDHELSTPGHRFAEHPHQGLPTAPYDRVHSLLTAYEALCSGPSLQSPPTPGPMPSVSTGFEAPGL